MEEFSVLKRAAKGLGVAKQLRVLKLALWRSRIREGKVEEQASFAEGVGKGREDCVLALDCRVELRMTLTDS